LIFMAPCFEAKIHFLFVQREFACASIVNHRMPSVDTISCAASVGPEKAVQEMLRLMKNYRRT
jgi:hypothetical protein